jgi:hypothetical protein
LLLLLLLDNAYDSSSDLSRPTREFWLHNDHIKNFVHDSWLSETFIQISETDIIKSDTDYRKSCIIASVERTEKNKLIYNKIDCNHQAGYICVKHAFGESHIKCLSLLQYFI